jgi:hypothetical protein
MSDCPSVREAILRTLAAEDGGIERRPILEHLERCPACREEGERVRALLGSLSGVEVPDPGELYWRGFLPRLRARIRAEGLSASAGRTRGFWSTAATAASFLLAALVFAGASPPEDTAARIRFARAAEAVEPERIEEALDLISPGRNLGFSALGEPDLLPREPLLEDDPQGVLPEEEGDLFDQVGRLDPESRQWLRQTLSPDWM